VCFTVDSGLTNLIHDRRGCTLFTLSSVDTSACLFHTGANGRVGYDTLTHSRLYSTDREKYLSSVVKPRLMS